MKDYKIRIGTRGSTLALLQAMEVSKKLNEIGYETEIIKIKSHGDIDQTPLSISKESGIFTKKINEELLNGNIDIAVHSMKDIPTKIEDGLEITAVLKRENYEDFFVSDKNIFDLSSGKVVGTSSPRRKSFLKFIRPDLKPLDIRGNVETRIKKLEIGEVDALILSFAGLKRLGMNVAGHVLDPDIFVPQANQGIIAVISKIDFRLNHEIQRINDTETYTLAMVERKFLEEMDAGCHSSVGVLARLINNKIILHIAYVDDKRYDYWTHFEISDLDYELSRFKRWFNGR